jgi:hypothetical protein
MTDTKKEIDPIEREKILADERYRINYTLAMNARPRMGEGGEPLISMEEVRKAVNGEYEMNGPQYFGKPSEVLQLQVMKCIEEGIQRGISLGRAEIVAKVREVAKDARECSTTMVDRDGYSDTVISVTWVETALTAIIEGEK